MKMSIETALAIFVPLIALMFTVMSFSRNKHHDTSAEATERANLAADVKYIRSGIDDMKVENRKTREDVSELTKKVVVIEESAKSAHRRIDEIVKG